jgi:hypothetical protein
MFEQHGDASPGVTSLTEVFGRMWLIRGDASSIRDSSILGFPCIPHPRPRNFPENHISNINMLKIYHEIRGNLGKSTLLGVCSGYVQKPATSRLFKMLV